MHIRFNRKDYEDLFKQASVVAGRNVNESLLNARLSVSNGVAVCDATDLENLLRFRIDGEVFQDGQEMVPAKLLHGAIDRSSGETITVKSNGNGVVVRSGGNTVKIGTHNGKLSAFPDISGFDSNRYIEIDKKVLAEMIMSTLPACGSTSARFDYSGVSFEYQDDMLYAVATNGNALSCMAVPAVNVGLNALEPNIVHKNSLALARTALKGDVKMYVHDNAVAFTSEGVEVRSSLIRGKFPNWRGIMNQERESVTAKVNAKDLKQAAKSALVSAGEDSALDFKLGWGNLDVSCKSEASESYSTLPVSYQGEDIRFRISGIYLTEMVRGSGEVELDVVDGDSPVMVCTETGLRILISPMLMG